MKAGLYEKKLLQKDHRWLKKKAIEVFNRFIRQRDSKDGLFICISCQKTKGVHQMNAGHYYPSVHESTRFDEDNVWGQCLYCNFHKHGNLTNYRMNLERKIGKEKLEGLDWLHSQKTKRTRYDLVQKILEYKQKISEF